MRQLALAGSLCRDVRPTSPRWTTMQSRSLEISSPMSGPVFLLAAAIAGGTLLMIVKTIAGAFAAGRTSSSELPQIREQCDHHAAALDEIQATLATQSAQLMDLQERLDFAERLLTQARNREALGPGDVGK